MTTLRPLPEIITELNACELEEKQLEARIRAERDKNEGEYYGELLGRKEDVQAHVAFLKRQVGETLASLTQTTQ